MFLADKIQVCQDRLHTRVDEEIFNILRAQGGKAEPEMKRSLRIGRYTQSLFDAGLMPGSSEYERKSVNDVYIAAAELPHEMREETQLDMRVLRCWEVEEGVCFFCLSSWHCDQHMGP